MRRQDGTEELPNLGFIFDDQDRRRQAGHIRSSAARQMHRCVVTDVRRWLQGYLRFRHQRGWRPVEGEYKAKRGSTARSILGPNSPAVRFDYGTANRQPQAKATPHARALSSVEL